MYLFFMCFKVWICTGEDPIHCDDTMCPKHGLGAAIVRIITLLIISALVMILISMTNFNIGSLIP